MEQPGGVGPVRGAFPVEVRLEDEPARARRGGEGEPVELLPPDAEEAPAEVEDAGGVERGDEGQVPPGGVGEAGDDARRVVHARRGHGGGDPGGADGDAHVTDVEPEAERRALVVAGARRDDRPAGVTPTRSSGPARRGRATS